MSHSGRLPFSVAKFTIEGVREGADRNSIRSAPPHLSGPHKASEPKIKLSFPANPFSLYRNCLPKLHAPILPLQNSVNSSSSHPSALFSSGSPCISSSQNPVDNCNNFSSATSVPSASSSSYVHSLFPNPFLIKNDSLVSQSSRTITQKTAPCSSISHTSSTPVQHIQPTNLSPAPSTVPHHPLPNTLTRKPRKPRPDRILSSSPFRPRVMAADRLFSWHTPYGLSHDKSLLAELPPALVESAKMSITGALAISSKSTYGAGLLRFNQFCDRWQISESARMPASYALLCAFIGNHKGSTSGKTIKSWLSGIRAWHLSNHAPWYGDDNWVKMARISANKEGSRHKRPLRAPVSIEHLLALRRAITITNHFHAAIWAVALVTFFGCRRLGETTVNSISSFSPNLHVLRSAEYVHLYTSFLSLTSFAVSLLPPYETAHGQHHFVFRGRKQLAKKVLPSLSQLVETSYALAQPCAIISPSITTFQLPPLSLPTPPPMGAGNT